MPAKALLLLLLAAAKPITLNDSSLLAGSSGRTQLAALSRRARLPEFFRSRRARPRSRPNCFRAPLVACPAPSPLEADVSACGGADVSAGSGARGAAFRTRRPGGGARARAQRMRERERAQWLRSLGVIHGQLPRVRRRPLAERLIGTARAQERRDERGAKFSRAADKPPAAPSSR